VFGNKKIESAGETLQGFGKILVIEACQKHGTWHAVLLSESIERDSVISSVGDSAHFANFHPHRLDELRCRILKPRNRASAQTIRGCFHLRIMPRIAASHFCARYAFCLCFLVTSVMIDSQIQCSSSIMMPVMLRINQGWLRWLTGAG
jgi:hypothetical protein